MPEHPHPEQRQAAEQKRPLAEQDKQERKERLQMHGRASVTRSIANAVVVKEGDVFFLSEPDGDVPLGGEHGFGLYYHDCRFLNGYELRLANAKPELLVATAHRGFMAIIELTNPDIRMSDGKLLRKEELGIKWERMIDSSTLAQPNFKDIQARLQDTSYRCLAQETEVHSDSILLNRVMDRSLRDLHLLRTTSDGQKFFAAGVPWFVTLFGRDSLIAALQTLAYDPDIAAQTLRLLAHYQGQKRDPWWDEEPGKIMHELRVGEMARLNEIPQTPYYGTVDATPLFLILIARLAAFLGIYFGHLLHDPYLDGAASIVIGVTLCVVALFLIRESRGLLIGEAADPEEIASVVRIVSNDPAVAAVNRVLTMYIGPSEVLLNLDVQFHSFLSAAQLSATVSRVEHAIRAQHPHIKRIFIEAVAVAASIKAAK